MKLTHQRPLLLWAVCSALILAVMPPRAVAADAKPPGKMAFQGFLTDASGVARGAVSPVNLTVTFRLYNSPTALAAAAVWAESQVVTVDKGHFSVVLGEGTSIIALAPGTPSDISAYFISDNATGRYLGITVSGETEIAPRIQFLSAPYAHLARYATELVGSNGTSMLKVGDGVVGVNLGGATPTSTLQVGGVVTATSFAGSGASLTSLNGANLVDGSVSNSKLATIATAGKVADSALSANVALRGSANTFYSRYSDPQIFSNNEPNNPTEMQLRLPSLAGGGATHKFALGIDVFGGRTGFQSADGGGTAFIQPPSGKKLLIQPGGYAVNTGIAGITMDTNGNVGIRLVAPEAPLHVVHPSRTAAQWGIIVDNSVQATWRGGIRLGDTGFFEFSNNAKAASPNYARLNGVGGWETVSDLRRKKDISPLTGLLQGALNLRPVRYHFKDEAPGDPLQIGFIAQEVREQFPSLVSEGEDLTLNYAGLSVVSIGAVKELHEVVRQQGAEMVSLRSGITTLETKNVVAIQELARQAAALSQSEARVEELEKKLSQMEHLERKLARMDTLEREFEQLKKAVARVAFLPPAATSATVAAIGEVAAQSAR